MKNPLSLLALLLLSLASPARAADDAAQLASLLDAFMAGASVDDAAMHQRFWADDLVYTSSAGERFGKREIIEGLQADEGAAEAGPAVVYTAEDVDIRVYGEAAVVAFRLVGTEQGEGGEVRQYFNTGTFFKRDGEWRAVAWQATRIGSG